MHRWWLTTLGWLLTVIAASAVGLVTVSLFSAGLAGTSAPPLRNDEVARALAASTAASGRPALPSAGPQRHDIGAARSLGSPGGTLIARCDGVNAYLLSWSPAQGWESESHIRGPARSAVVTFERDSDAAGDQQITVTVTCRDGQPVAATVPTDD